ncbi:excisionase family DNA-binding protein [Anaerostipes sp. Marseille-Q3525]|uniref:excisionase family DNA-binding protein n=1 Tax=Anaerostipes sp. Marseille-Q3525 TaxID=2758418 RepID=UPI001BA7FA88|nr:excisionase family DNA-binding protein [Anaerostipes sp. Marseille-Q3525]MBR9961236.1 excisionase family DNA-binding protein [Anaerostipes sp. Marseille-Q3525]
MQGMYLEQRVEQLEREIRELKKQKKNEQYLSPAQFAEKMSCSKSFVTKMVKSGEIQALRMGKLIRIPMSQFEEKEGAEQSWKDIVFKGA